MKRTKFRGLKVFRPTPRRQFLIDDIKACLERMLVAKDWFGFDVTAELVGFLSNFGNHSYGDIQVAMEALLPVMPTPELEEMRYAARFRLSVDPKLVRKQNKRVAGVRT